MIRSLTQTVAAVAMTASLLIARTASLLIAMTASLLFVVTVPAGAHAELIEASPGRSSTVGGSITTISLQFVGLAHPGDHDVMVFDPLDDRVEILLFDQDFNRIDLTVPPLTVEGEYVVRYTTLGADQDTNTGEFAFMYDEDAPPPEGITALQQPGGLRIDAVTITLLAVTGLSVLVWIAYVVTRLRQPPSGDLKDLDDGHDDLVGTD